MPVASFMAVSFLLGEDGKPQRRRANATLNGRIVGSLWDDRFIRLCENGKSGYVARVRKLSARYAAELLGGEKTGIQQLNRDVRV
jgi:hypothetical protein